RDRLDRLRLHAVVRRHDEHRDVRDLRAARAHRGERLVTGRVEERDLPAVVFDLVGADVLRDAAGLARGHVRRTDGVEEARLAVVDVAQDGDDRRPVLQLARVLFGPELHLAGGCFGLRGLLGSGRLGLRRRLEPELGRDERRGVEVDGLVDRGHDAHTDELLDDVDAADIEDVRELADHDGLGQDDRRPAVRAGLDRHRLGSGHGRLLRLRPLRTASPWAGPALRWQSAWSCFRHQRFSSDRLARSLGFAERLAQAGGFAPRRESARRSDCLARAASAISARSRSAVTSSIVTASARPRAPSRRPRSRHTGSGSRYAPRPAAFPRRSTESPPAGERTTRTSSRFARTVRQATHVRCGVGRPAPLAPVPLLLPSEERAVLFIQVLLVSQRRLRLDLGDEVVTDLGVLSLRQRHRLRGRGLDDRLGLGLELGADLGLASDVDAPTGELRGETGVLALLADRQRQLAVRHDDVRGLVLRDDVDAHDVRGLERVGDVLLGLLAPLDDVDLLATELVDDRLHAQTALPDARAAGVDAGLARADGDLGARAGLASDADDLDLPVIDLRDLELEEPLHEKLVRAADDDGGPAQRAAYLEDHHFAVLPDEVPLVRRLLVARQDGLGLAELHDRGARFEAADLPVDDVAFALGVLREDLLALVLAQRLLDDLLRGLRADATERRRRLLERHDVAQLRVRLDALRRLQLDLELRVLDLLHDGLEQIDLEGPRRDVDLDVDVLFGAIRTLERARDDVANDLFGETLFGGELR